MCYHFANRLPYLYRILPSGHQSNNLIHLFSISAGLDIGKMYADHHHQQQQQASQQQHHMSSPRSSDSPDVKPIQDRLEGNSSSSSTTTSSAGASPGALPPGYYPTSAMQQSTAGLLPMAQYAGQYPSQIPGSEFRKPLTVIF